MVFLVGERVHWIEIESIQLNKNIRKFAYIDMRLVWIFQILESYSIYFI